MDFLPIALKIKNKKVIVVGGGKVAQRKTGILLEAGAKVTLISPDTTEELRQLAKATKIKWLKRCLKKSDIFGASLIIAATNNASLNEQVSLWARKAKIAINVVDGPILSDFISPALLKKDRALIAVYTDGKDPVLSRDLKNYLGDKWDDFLLFRNRS